MHDAHVHRPRARSQGLWLWVLAVLLLWTAAHALNRWVLRMDERSEAARFAFWTGAKVVAWLWPTWLLLRQSGRAAASWLGLATGRGLGTACLWSALWICFQETGVLLQWPMFSQPAAELTWSALATSLLVAPCFEELMFRGAMLRTLKEAGHSRVASVLLCAFAFALLHLPGWLFRRGLDPALAGAFLSISFFGAVAGWLAWRVPSLWAAILFHFANNFWSTGALEWLLQR